MTLLIKVLIVYPLEQRWYDYLNYQFSSEDSINYYILANSKVSNRAKGTIPVSLGSGGITSRGLLTRMFGGIKELQEIIDKISPDIVISKELFSSLSYQVTRVKGEFKHVIWCDEVISPQVALYGNFPLTRFYFEHNAKRVKYLFFISHRSKESLYPYCRKARKFLVIYPGVDTFLEKPKEKNDKKEFSFLFLGNVASHKGIKTILTSLPLLRKITDKKFSITIAGKGPLANLVQSFAKESDFVRYLGYVSDQEKKNLLRNCDAFIYPSEDINFLWLKRWEEQGAISAIEAMAASLPVIASNCGSLPEFIRNDKLLVKQGDEYSLAEKMKLLLEDRDYSLEIGKINLKWSYENCNGPEQSKKVNDFLKEIAEDRVV